MSWRANIASVREQETGTPSQGWRADIMAVATARGHNANGWREAVRMFAGDYGVTSGGGWRADVAGIATALGQTAANGWRDGLRFISENLDTPGRDILFFINTPPRQPNAIYRVLADGIVTAIGEVMA